uniref:Type III-B CRISPR module RAMP protein Cmr6 n=1 Tax=Thermocrinis ruber TaxID=75906 RepID=A0A7C5SZ15_9AQUI
MKVRQIKELLSQVDNPALLFNKLLVLQYAEQISQNQDVKKIEYIESFMEILKGKKSPPPPELEGVKQESFRLKTAYRLVIGAGYPSFIENGFLFHHVYGIPYIPGETLKGLARAVFILSVAEAVKEETKLSELEKELSEEVEGIYYQIPKKINIILDDYTIENPVETFRKIFGSKKRRGQVIFFDAYPVDFNPSEHFEADIMNSHYGEYYQSGKAPADWLNPNPIHFLALKEGVVFEFSLGLAPLEPMENNEEKLFLATARRLLEVGLKNFGVGNKKRKGYGWFSDKAVGR